MAVVDLRTVLAGAKETELAERSRILLYTALTRLLQSDFAAGEKYLDEYRALCKIALPSNPALADRLRAKAEERRRQASYFAVLARGREKQGRLSDAVRAYRDLYDATLGGDLLALPDDPAVQVRPDLWVRSHVAEMLARATPEQRAALRIEIEREAKALPADDVAALNALRRAVRCGAWSRGSRGREVRLKLAMRLADGEDRRLVLAGLLELQTLEQEGDREMAARALEARAQVLTKRGLVEDATACYRKLARVRQRRTARQAGRGQAFLAVPGNRGAGVAGAIPGSYGIEGPLPGAQRRLARRI